MSSTPDRPAAAPATGWTRSCAVLPPICAATWIGKSTSRAFNGVTVAPINRGTESLIRPPTGRTESPDSIISTAAAAEFRSEHLWSARIRSVGPEGGSVSRVWHGELVGWVALAFQSRQSLHAEVLFLRRQL